MNQRLSTPGDRLPLLIAIGVFAVMLACLPLVFLMDDNTDENRPMYEDMLRMETMQIALIANDERPVATTVSDGESVKVGSKEFVASPGVTVVVRATDKDSFCVSASNDLGKQGQERCSK